MFMRFVSPSFSETSLYNLKDDLGEEKSIAEQHPELVQELLKKLEAWQKDVTKDVKKRT